jgi:hypothetical protein
MNRALTYFAANWKTTVSGLLTLVTITGGYFAAIPTAALQQNGITQKEIFWATVAVGLAKLYVDVLKKDAK